MNTVLPLETPCPFGRERLPDNRNPLDWTPRACSPCAMVTGNPPVQFADDQERKDFEHLRLLSVFHVVFGGLAALGIGFLGLHWFLMNSLFSNPALWKSQKDGPFPPEWFFGIFIWFYLFMGFLFATACVLNVLSGAFLLQRKHRTFSLVVAALDCLQVPLGTVLGAFTLTVLLRDPMRRIYGE